MREEYLDKMTDEYREGYAAGRQQGFMEGFHAGIKRVMEMLEGGATYGGDHDDERAGRHAEGTQEDVGDCQ